MSWTRGPTVGRGSSAAVSVAAAPGSGDVFAVKSAEASRSESLRRERAILAELDCPHVVTYRGWDVTSEAGGRRVCNLLMEYAPRGTLADAAAAAGVRGGRLGEPAVRWCARGILRGLEYVHGRGVAHCDIKGQNILVTGEGPKIADFGLARRVGGDWAAEGPVGGTPLFMAPEVARGERPGFAADVWSLGCTVIEIATGRPPWADVSDPISAIHRIGFSGESPEIPSFLSEQCRDFLSKCLRRDPSERWSAGELLRHPFLEEAGEETPEFLSEEAQTKIPDTESPTSVLEQAAIWSSLENSEPCHPLLQRSPPNSPPGERIQQLIGEWSANSIPPPQMPNWEQDESWVTVRSSEESREAPETSPRANANANEEEEVQEEVQEEDQEDQEGLVVGSCRYGHLESSSDREREGDDDSTLWGCNVLGSCGIVKFVKIELENCQIFPLAFLRIFTYLCLYIRAFFFLLSCSFLAKTPSWEPVAFAVLLHLTCFSFFLSFVLFCPFDVNLQECSFFGAQIQKLHKKKKITSIHLTPSFKFT